MTVATIVIRIVVEVEANEQNPRWRGDSWCESHSVTTARGKSRSEGQSSPQNEQSGAADTKQP